jgi:hypothetical protein
MQKKSSSLVGRFNPEEIFQVTMREEEAEWVS